VSLFAIRYRASQSPTRLRRVNDCRAFLDGTLFYLAAPTSITADSHTLALAPLLLASHPVV